MTQLFALHSAYGLATAAAALDGGLLGERGERLLVPFHSSRVPETSVGIVADPALASLRGRFDRIEDFDELLSPMHPSSWQPEPSDLPVLRRLLTRAWRLDDDLEILLQSPQVAPARTLMLIFPNARITIIGDGLMTYSPMRIDLPHTVTARIGRVVHADVVPGVVPLVSSPYAEPVAVSPELFGAALREVADAVPDHSLPDHAEPDHAVPDHVAPRDEVSTVLVLGQYLSALGLVSEAEEIALQSAMIDRAAARDPQRIVFKPHPSAPPRLTDALRDRAAFHAVEFREYRGALSAEMLAERLDARAVIAGFSTALPTVQTVFGRTIDAVGADTVLARLTPYENSNRVPATIVDALTRANSPYRDPERMQLLVDAVGYAMQPRVARHLRPRAVELLAAMTPTDRDRYFDAERLTELRLPGAPAASAVRRALRPAGGVGRVEELRLTATGARRRLARAWRAIRGR